MPPNNKKMMLNLNAAAQPYNIKENDPVQGFINPNMQGVDFGFGGRTRIGNASFDGQVVMDETLKPRARANVTYDLNPNVKISSSADKDLTTGNSTVDSNIKVRGGGGKYNFSTGTRKRKGSPRTKYMNARAQVKEDLEIRAGGSNTGKFKERSAGLTYSPNQKLRVGLGGNLINKDKMANLNVKYSPTKNLGLQLGAFKNFENDDQSLKASLNYRF